MLKLTTLLRQVFINLLFVYLFGPVCVLPNNVTKCSCEVRLQKLKGHSTSEGLEFFLFFFAFRGVLL